MKFIPLDSSVWKQHDYCFNSHYAQMSYAEAVSNGVFEWFKTNYNSKLIGFDYETNGLYPKMRGFAISGVGLSLKKDASHTPFPMDCEILKSNGAAGLVQKDYQAVWIDFREDTTGQKEFIEFLLEIESNLMGHNSAYEYKVSKQVYGITLLDMKDSMAYIAATLNGFTMALKQNARTILGAHDWEKECDTYRKDLAKELGGDKNDYWAEVPNNILGPYCAWDTIYTVALAEEIYLRTLSMQEVAKAGELPQGFFTPNFSSEPYRSQILLSGEIEGNGVPITYDSFNGALAKTMQGACRSMSYILGHMGLTCDLINKFNSEELILNEEIDLSREGLSTLKKEYLEILELFKEIPEYQYMLKIIELGNKITPQKEEVGGNYVPTEGGNNILKFMPSTEMHSFKKESIIEFMKQFPIKDSEANDFPELPLVNKFLGQLMFSKGYKKIYQDLSNYKFAEIGEDGLHGEILSDQFLTTKTGIMYFSWFPVSKDTLRWGSGFHIVSPRGYNHATYEDDNRIHLHADLSSAELQSSAAQAGDLDYLLNFITGADNHALLAQKMYKLSTVEEVEGWQRDMAKIFGFRTIFGSAVEGMAKTCGMTVEEATDHLALYMKENPGYRKMTEELKPSCEEYKCRVLAFGDLRQLPDNHKISTKWWNLGVQHFSSNSFGHQQWECQKAFKHYDMDVNQIGFIHDSFDYRVAPEEVFRTLVLTKVYLEDRQSDNWGTPARLDYEMGSHGTLFLHAHNYRGTGTQSSPWKIDFAGPEVTVKSFFEKMDKSSLNCSMEVTKENDNTWDTTRIKRIKKLAHKWFNMILGSETMSTGDMSVTMTFWTEDTKYHTTDLKIVERGTDGSTFDLNWPKKTKPWKLLSYKDDTKTIDQ